MDIDHFPVYEHYLYFTCKKGAQCAPFLWFLMVIHLSVFYPMKIIFANSSADTIQTLVLTSLALPPRALAAA